MLQFFSRNWFFLTRKAPILHFRQVLSEKLPHQVPANIWPFNEYRNHLLLSVSERADLLQNSEESRKYFAQERVWRVVFGLRYGSLRRIGSVFTVKFVRVSRIDEAENQARTSHPHVTVTDPAVDLQLPELLSSGLTNPAASAIVTACPVGSAGGVRRFQRTDCS
jgi:hypothetical protein